MPAAGAPRPRRGRAGRCCRRCRAAPDARRLRQDHALDRELDVDHPAGAVLEVEAPVLDRMRGARLPRIALTSPISAARSRGAARTWRRTASKRGAGRFDAGAPAHQAERLVLPGPGGVAAAAGLVVRRTSRSRSTRRNPLPFGHRHRRVDVEQLAGGGSRRQPADQLAHERAVDLGGLVGVGLGIVVDEDDVEVAAVAELLAAELAVGDDGELRLGPVRRLEVRPGPAQGAREVLVGERRKGRRRPARP